MEIQIHRRPDELDLTTQNIKELCRKVSLYIGLEAKYCSVIFVDIQEIIALHRDYLNDPSPTDVITFDVGDDAVEGEIYLCPQQAKIQAEEYGVSFREEVIRLIIHGILHLKGYNDIEAEERREMKTLENELVTLYSKKM